MSNMCTVFLATWLIAVTLYVAHINVYIFHKNKLPKYLVYVAEMPNLVGIFVLSTYLAIKHGVCIELVVLWHICANILGLYAHLACWLCDLHL